MPARLLFYTRGLEEGGAEKHIERLAVGLHGAGFEVSVSYSDAWGPVGDRLLAAGLAVLRFPARDHRSAESAIREAAPDIFHSFTHKDAVDLAAAAAAGVPVIAVNRINVREWDPGMTVRDWEHARNRLTHRFTAVSHAAAAVCEKVEGVPQRRITVLHTGVPAPDGAGLRNRDSSIRQELGLGAETQLIGYVANYRPEKDHDTLLRAFRLTLDQRPDTHLVCCGIATAETRARLSALARECHIDAHVSLLGSRSDVGGVFRGLDLYVHSSRFEGFSNSLLEAMAHGLPVVATSAGGNPEAVEDGVTGLLAPPGDARSFADAMAGLLSDDRRLSEFGRAGRLRQQSHFSLGKMMERYTTFYQEALAAAAHA